MGKWGLLMLTLAAACFAFAPASLAQSDECLVEYHDASGVPLPDKGSLCQTTTGRSCVFDLQLCLNQLEAGCTPAAFTKKKFRASGHCGPVGRLQVATNGAEAVCGTVTPIKVRTRVNGKRPGQCTIRTAVRSGATAARTDVDRITLVCNPQAMPCPSTTTTTVAGSTTTTVATSSTTTTTM